MKNENRPERVLHIVSSMDRGGAETLIMSIYRNINRDAVQFDFITHTTEKNDFEVEILQLGGRIYKIPSLGQAGPFLYIKNLRAIMKNETYKAVHIHTDFQGGFPALAAKISGIKKRICHSHSNSWPRGNRSLHKVSLKILQSLIKSSATDYCSCSKEAGEFLFGNSEKVNILKNGIDINYFANIDDINKTKLLDELNLPKSAIMIGHVGRFSSSKNHKFILMLLKKLLENDKRFFLLLAGDGPLRSQVEEEAAELKIMEHIRFLGVRDDIPKLMNRFDVFLFPSRFEGFGIVTVEAQSSGTPCVVSDTVPKSTDMGLGLVSYVSLNESIDVWCQKINDALLIERPNKNTIIEKISQQGYSIQENIKDWLNLYGVS